MKLSDKELDRVYTDRATALMGKLYRLFNSMNGGHNEKTYQKMVDRCKDALRRETDGA